MDILTIDFETYYDQDYSLSKMTTIEYVADARFQPIMMSYALNEDPVQCAIGYNNIKKVLEQYNWDNTVLNAQNTQFDGLILRERFGKTAAFYADTMAMARVTGAHIFEGASLRAISNLLQELGIYAPKKGTAVAAAKGMHLYDMYSDMPYLALENALNDTEKKRQGHELLMHYRDYCNDDVELARTAFKYFSQLLSPDEMKFGDMILKCYLKPSTYLDLKTIQDEIVRIEERDRRRATDIAVEYFNGSIPQLRACCRSAPKFTDFLKSQGGVLLSEQPVQDETYILENGLARFIIPERYSEKKGRVEPCYSKSYSGMIDMCNHPDKDIADIFKIKLDMTSSIELSRAKRFENIAKLQRGFGFPYVVSGAHTHRLGGSGGLNLQNLSSGRKEGQSKALKQSITAPTGMKVLVLDSSQIELRSGAFIANDQDMLQVFKDKQDPYSNFAAVLYGGDPVTIKTNAKQGIEPFAGQRQMAKSALLSCIYGTGAYGFQNYLKTNGIDMEVGDCQNIVNVYRTNNPLIVRVWNNCEQALKAMIAGGEGYFGGADNRLFYYNGSRQVHGRVVAGIRLPDGNWINYYNIRQEMRKMPDGSEKINYAYTGMKEGRVKTIYTYASKVFENLNQALAFSIMKYQALLINKKYQIVLNTHDEWGVVVPDEEVEQAQAYMSECMKSVPEWAQGLPLDCEGSYAQNYGDCK